jgi:hypothetical protein
MPRNSNVEQFFAVVEESMKLKFRDLEKDLPHQGEKGGVRERRVADFLSSILPTKYGIGTGHIISTQEPFISYQTDIVIYDASNGVALPYDDYYSLFPCECVYAAIEVKSRLKADDSKRRTKTTIYECMESTTRLKKLKQTNLPRIHSIVFAYETAWNKENAPNKVKYWFEFLGEKYSLELPEMVFVLDPGFVLAASGPPPSYNEDDRLPILYPTASLLHFISDLIHRLSEAEAETTRAKIPIANLRSYKQWYPGDLQARVWKEGSGWQDIHPLQIRPIKLTKKQHPDD